MYQSGFWQETDGSFKLGNSKFHKEDGKDYRNQQGMENSIHKAKADSHNYPLPSPTPYCPCLLPESQWHRVLYLVK